MSLPERATAREALVYVAGDAHALHGVRAWWREGRFVVIRCSCDAAFKVAYAKDFKDALRNVLEVQVS